MHVETKLQCSLTVYAFDGTVNVSHSGKIMLHVNFHITQSGMIFKALKWDKESIQR